MFYYLFVYIGVANEIKHPGKEPVQTLNDTA